VAFLAKKDIKRISGMNTAYLDNNATTRVDPRVVEAMMPLFSIAYGNPSSMHALGAAAKSAVHRARVSVQDLIGAVQDSEVIFTSGGTESDNLAILSALEASPRRREIVTSAVEHPAVRTLCEFLEQNKGIRVHMIPVDRDGHLDISAYEAALSERIALVTIMWANNETGTIFPVAELAERAKAVGALFHTDAVQAAGKVPIDLKSTAIDMLSLAAHKMHGPKGVGALYVRKGVRFRPQIKGGNHERGRRAGTENTPGIVGFGKAAELAAQHLPEEASRVRALRDRLEQALTHQIRHCFAVGDRDNRLPNTTSIAFEYIEGEGILLLLDRAGIAASLGSACSTGSFEPSHVMRAMKVPDTALHGVVRFSLSRDNTEADIDRVVDVMPGILDKLRAISPFGSQEGAPQTPSQVDA
jgi:cysteine desulfurase